MTAEVSSRWVGCRVAGVEVAIDVIILMGCARLLRAKPAVHVPGCVATNCNFDREQTAPYAPPIANCKGTISQYFYIPIL
jgi:hypothetical protein